MIISRLIKLSLLRSAGRIFGEAIVEVSPEASASFGRWANAWRLYLRGEATPETLATLKQEMEFLAEQSKKLKNESEQISAMMELFGRTPKDIPLDPNLLARVARASKVLDPAREQLVVKAAQALHAAFTDLVQRETAGAALSEAEKRVLPHLKELKGLLGNRYDDFASELSRECVAQLKSSAAAPLALTASKLNSIQGAVGQFAFFRTRQFRLIVASKLKDLRKAVREAFGRGWTAAAITDGRIYTIVKLPTGEFVMREYVDGAIACYEKVAQGRLSKGFLGFGAQVKVERRISAMPQNVLDAVRENPVWEEGGAILLIPTGGNAYKPLQMVPPPASIVPERMLMAAEGGRWPSNPLLPAGLAKTIRADAPLTRDACRSIGEFVLDEIAAALGTP
jgi:hypothetical protein